MAPMVSIAIVLTVNLSTPTRIAYICSNVIYVSLTLYKFIEGVRNLKKIDFQPILMIFVGEGVIFFIGCVGAYSIIIAVSGH